VEWHNRGGAERATKLVFNKNSAVPDISAKRCTTRFAVTAQDWSFFASDCGGGIRSGPAGNFGERHKIRAITSLNIFQPKLEDLCAVNGSLIH